MMDDVEAGKVNCIVTKDLSRFGREHVMMDYYLEFLFPEKRVRYIAVAENEDTEKGLSDFVPFKNLFNEWFAKDTSRKVKTAFKAKFAAGQRISAYAPLGYKKHPEIKNKLIIDEETRWIVEKIFDLAIHGKGAASITRILIAEKVPTPGFINFQRDGTFANIYAGAPEEKGYAWTIAQVKSIMKDETYIGHTIHYRETNISFKNKRRITYKLKLNGGDMKSVQGDSGHAQVKMVADVYSHIIDDDRRLNAERLEAAFYSGRQATPEPVQPVTQESSTDDKELLLKLLQNPEMAALLKSLAKTL